MNAWSNKIFIGHPVNFTYAFNNEDLYSVEVNQEVSLVGQELSIDTMSFITADKYENVVDVDKLVTSEGHELVCRGGQVLCLSYNGITTTSALIDLPYGTPIWYYSNNKLVGKFFSDTVSRVGKNKYKVDCISSVGLLDKSYHAGGMISSQTMASVIADILDDGTGYPAIKYEVGVDVADIIVNGWLPRDTKRNNLYQVLFAYGVNMIKNPEGDVYFSFIYPSANPPTIEDARIFNKGNVKYEKPYSSISVTEHTFTYISTENAQTIYDNSAAESVLNQQVWFSNAPIKVSTITASEGLTIVSATENGAVVSGQGKLTGIPYVHTKRNVVRNNALSESEKTVTVSNCTMVNITNSENLIDRLYAFYCPNGNRETVTNAIVCGEERTGNIFSLSNPFSESLTAYLTKMSITASTFNKADCEFIANYTPAGQSGLYQHCIVLDADTFAEDGGVFTVPPEVFQSENPSIKVVMIGGGQGGQSGYPGENGGVAYGDFNLPADFDVDWSKARKPVFNLDIFNCYVPLTSEKQTYKGDSYIYPYHTLGLKGGAEGGAGGDGGNGGNPGRTKIVTINNPSATYNYTIGVGGEGGARVGFRPDTAADLRSTLHMENPNVEYTDAQINAMIATEETYTNWRGTVNNGSLGTASTFGSFSSSDVGSYVPQCGVYDPIHNKYYAMSGDKGVNGGHGGSRTIDNEDGTISYVQSGENVTYNGITYYGGIPGEDIDQDPRMQRNIANAEFKRTIIHADAGNGAGAAVGLSRYNNVGMDGLSNSSYSYTFEYPEYTYHTFEEGWRDPE